MENQDPNKEEGIPRWKPQLWMKFHTVAEAWDFWEYYGGRMGFSVRRRYTNTSKIDGVVTGCKFVCFKEGKKAADKRDSLTKRERAEIRTGCMVPPNEPGSDQYEFMGSFTNLLTTPVMAEDFW
ncbi:hypothetical protein QYE76_053723 [Lolium multiflorum]|uniref:FAR1 domain-containing protein n=1 Tax=Lolium multiflorum TaxID=4521 RepID=A0AAD8SXG6_LOLMU|nr:hypothetical protein QYE76_053723 [Lolium multiflorum]